MLPYGFFARIRLSIERGVIQMSFVTIWIFARIRHVRIGVMKMLSFVTIWIFARIRFDLVAPTNVKFFVM